MATRIDLINDDGFGDILAYPVIDNITVSNEPATIRGYHSILP